LTHDDVVDKAALRRGAASLNALWDDRTAVLSGDYLVARSIELLAELGSCPVITNTFNAVRQMTEGELGSLARGGCDYTQQDCIRLAEQKTASYFAATCSAPTYTTGLEYRAALHEYGLALGIAFQIIDDILDITQQEKALGKPSCGDIVEGKGTLPLLFLSQQLDAGDQRALRAMVGGPITDEQRRWLAAKLASTGARDKAETVAQHYADDACATIADLPESPYKEAMRGLTRFILVRDA
jgi:octaprenyl-diphosphate synthase